MAVKGKKKSQARGSQGRRRPAQAPRPVVAGRRRTPWYRTQTGVLLGSIAALVTVGLVIYGVMNARTTAAESSRLRTSLTRYTGEIRSLLESVRPPVAAMVAVPTEGPPPEELFTQAESWVKELEAAATRAQAIPPASGQQEAQRIFAQATALYVDAARTFSDAALANEASQKPILLRAAAQRDHATAFWQVGVSLLDSARSEAGLAPSGLSSPGEPSAGAQPPPQATPSPSPGGDDGGRKNGDKPGGGDKGGDD